MSYADQVFIQNCKDILSKGVWDTDRQVRPRWEDGSPAHTVKLFGIVNRYDLRQEFPILTVRKQFIKNCFEPTPKTLHVSGSICLILNSYKFSWESSTIPKEIFTINRSALNSIPNCPPQASVKL